MPKHLTLTLPDGTTVEAPDAIPQGGLESGGKGESILQNGIQVFLIAVVVLSVVFLIWGGIKWITASGDKTKLDSARKTIIYAIVGLVLSLLSFTIVSLVGSAIGIDFL